MKTVRLLTICLILQIAVSAQQAEQAWLEISGDVPHPRTFQEQDWKQLKHVSISANNAHEKRRPRIAACCYVIC
jgi:hypothetical protein